MSSGDTAIEEQEPSTLTREKTPTVSTNSPTDHFSLPSKTHNHEAINEENQSPQSPPVSVVVEKINSPKDESVKEDKRGPRAKTNVDKAGGRKSDENEVKICRYFARNGKCWYGDRCRYQHVFQQRPATRKKGTSKKERSEERQEILTQNEGVKEKLNARRQPAVAVKKKELLVTELSQEDLAELRVVEISQLTKRFPSEKWQMVADSMYQVILSATDPDWPYDVKDVQVKVTFPLDYPKEMCMIEVLQCDILPGALVVYMNEQINEWLTDGFKSSVEMGRVELVFRPFLRWFDRNMEDFFTEGLKMYKKELLAKDAGLEFIPFRRKPGKPHSRNANDETPPQQQPTERAIRESTQHEQQQAEQRQQLQQDEQQGQENSPAATNEARGTEVKLRGLELGDGVGTIQCLQVAIIFACSRCKALTDTVLIKTGSDKSMQCSKCQKHMSCCFRSAFMHQFSHVLGYLDLNTCIPTDLILPDCQFNVSCLNCSQAIKIEGMTFDSRKESSCQSCYQKLSVNSNSVRFFALTDTNSQNDKPVDMKESKKRRNDGPQMILGRALRDQGTCKHFKKSFRWLRFPCCGKVYPCDICHDENETNHEMKYATRMICGFCSKEQAYSSTKACSGCKSSLTKSKTAHWEGGKGCRDKTTMSKNDQQKYANLNKTTSKKVQEAKKK